MRDSQSSNIDFSAVLVMLLAIVAAAGFSSAGAVIASKDQAIAAQQQRIEQLELDKATLLGQLVGRD